MAIEKKKQMATAQDLFVNRFWTAKDIAEFLSVTENTVGRWREKGDWDKQQEDTINDPLKMRRLIAKQMLKVAGGDKSEVDADALAKLFKVFEGFTDKINPGIVAAVMKLYDEYLVGQNPELAVKNLDYNKKFLLYIVEKHG